MLSVLEWYYVIKRELDWLKGWVRLPSLVIAFSQVVSHFRTSALQPRFSRPRDGSGGWEELRFFWSQGASCRAARRCGRMAWVLRIKWKIMDLEASWVCAHVAHESWSSGKRGLEVSWGVEVPNLWPKIGTVWRGFGDRLSVVWAAGQVRRHSDNQGSDRNYRAANRLLGFSMLKETHCGLLEDQRNSRCEDPEATFNKWASKNLMVGPGNELLTVATERNSPRNQCRTLPMLLATRILRGDGPWRALTGLTGGGYPRPTA